MDRNPYYRMNFSALWFSEIYRTNGFLFILLSPLLVPILLVLKFFRIRALTGVAMPAEIELKLVGPTDWIRTQKGLGEFEDEAAANGFAPLGLYLIQNFPQACYVMATIDKTRSVYGIWYLSMVGGRVQIWMDMASKLVSGESVTSSTSPSAGAIRSRPGATFYRRVGVGMKTLYEHHLEKLHGQSLRTRLSEEFENDFCDGWRQSFGYYIETGLYVAI